MSGHTNFNGFTPGGGIPSSFMNRDNEDSPARVSKEEPIDEHEEMITMNHFQPNPTIKNEPGEFNDTPTPQPMEDYQNFHSSKHICQVCGDRASGKHYGLYSCEGCKGFFKRTVRKELTYSCRDNKQCVIDKRQRNRCQYCRYQKCLRMGMKREAVQGETNFDDSRRGVPPGGITEPLSPVNQGNPYEDMPVDQIAEAESEFDRLYERTSYNDDSNGSHVHDYLASLIAWTKIIPQFESLKRDDQVYLVQSAWNEITIADIAHKSIDYEDVLLIGKNESLSREQAVSTHVEVIFERVMTELVQKMREMNLDRTELGCLKAIVLYNPDIKQLQDSHLVEELREKVYASLETYAKQKYPDQPGRFAKLLLRLPALRSIGLKCLESMFLFKTVGDPPQVTTVRNYF